MGRMSRSANRKAITPPKLMPPFHSTAASGTLPTEQTNESTATRGPISGPQTRASTGVAGEKERLPEAGWHKRGQNPRDDKAERDVGRQSFSPLKNAWGHTV